MDELTISVERAAFEAWWKSSTNEPLKLITTGRRAGGYARSPTSNGPAAAWAWDAWIARAALGKSSSEPEQLP